MITGGTPVTISFAGEEFTYTGDAKPNFKDGINVTQESNADGSLRELYEINPGMIEGNTVEADWDTFQRLIALKNTVGEKDVSIALQDGTIVVGVGKPVGEMEFDASRAVASFDVGVSRNGKNSPALKSI